MKPLFISILFALATFLFGQTSFQDGMDKALKQLEQAETQEDFLTASESFSTVASDYPDRWEPLYYTILTKTIYAFFIPTPDAMELVENIESDYEKLTKLKDNDETKVLKGMFLTVKVAKNPMKYGQSLTPVIMSTYHTARKDNPKNPRLLYQMAEYEMAGAPYMGQDPKAYCPLLEEAVMLFEEEAKTPAKGFEPRWGMDRAKELLANTCE